LSSQYEGRRGAPRVVVVVRRRCGQDVLDQVLRGGARAARGAHAQEAAVRAGGRPRCGECASGGREQTHTAVSRRPPNPCSDPIVARTEGLHVRHESLGTRAIFCRAVLNLGHCYDSQLFRRCTPARRRVYSPLGGGRSGWPVVRFKMLSGPFTQPPFRPSPTLTAAAAPGGGNQRRYVPR
jgi:hypothetical protein